MKASDESEAESIISEESNLLLSEENETDWTDPKSKPCLANGDLKEINFARAFFKKVVSSKQFFNFSLKKVCFEHCLKELILSVLIIHQ